MHTTFLIAAIATAGVALGYEADLKIGPQNCFEPFSHKDVSALAQQRLLEEACKLAGMIGPDDKGIVAGGHLKREPWLDYRYVVTWIPGCTTVREKMDTRNPIPGDEVDCEALLRGNYEKCNNGGVGGWIDVGCLRYGFSIVDFPADWSEKNLKDEEKKISGIWM